jgi:hypothetical protein
MPLYPAGWKPPAYSDAEWFGKSAGADAPVDADAAERQWQADIQEHWAQASAQSADERGRAR